MTKVLIAEDDQFLVKVYNAKLNKAGFQVKVVGDGEATLKEMKDFDPDLVLLDLMMPKKDGFTVLEEIKQMPELKKIPVIVATNLSQDEDKKKVMELGAVDFIVKSDITLEELVQKITKLARKA